MAHHFMSRVGTGLTFLREYIRSPRAVGSLYPSSSILARKMAERIDINGTGLVVELGAGTGCVTEALLAHGVSPERLLVVERSPALVEILKSKFKNINIVMADACNLSAFIPPCHKVDSIVSSLPFASLDSAICGSIISEIKKYIGQGNIIQYTYLLGSSHMLGYAGFQCISRSTVWRNFPPATVMEFILPDTGSGVV